MACYCSLKARLSGGDGSRTGQDLDKLMKAGWCVDKNGKSYVLILNTKDRPNTTPTVRAICTFAIDFSVFRPFSRFSLVYEGH